jgi:hypothetical protein
MSIPLRRRAKHEAIGFSISSFSVASQGADVLFINLSFARASFDVFRREATRRAKAVEYVEIGVSHALMAAGATVGHRGVSSTLYTLGTDDDGLRNRLPRVCRAPGLKM